MQTQGAYVEQIPAGAKPPTPAPPVLKLGPVDAARPAPAGLYVQVALATSQEQALRAAMELTQRLAEKRPPFIRGEVVGAGAQRRLALYAGPFAGEAGARAFCDLALPGQACLARRFETASAPGGGGPARPRTPPPRG